MGKQAFDAGGVHVGVGRVVEPAGFHGAVLGQMIDEHVEESDLVGSPGFSGEQVGKRLLGGGAIQANQRTDKQPQALFTDNSHPASTIDSLGTTKLCPVLGRCNSEPCEAIPLPERRIDLLLLRRLVSAQRASEALRPRYQPMDHADPVWFWAAPSRFAGDRVRWHARVFNADVSRYQDLVFPRILEVGETRPAGPLPPDAEWLATIDVRLVPAARLSQSQAAVIAQDYGMVDGQTAVRVRLALLFLFWRRLNLDRPDCLVDVENREEAEAMLGALRLRQAGGL